MESESIVYGCIRDWPSDDPELRRLRGETNHGVLAELPGAGLYQTQVIHFGASYGAIEYEWNLWIEAFEALLKRLYWASAVVHLETELNGLHTFRWESDNGFHSPQEGALRVRCAWEREGMLRS